MQYNLLNYGVSGVRACTSFDLSLTHKDAQLKKIINYLKPDVLMVNEMGCNTILQKRILQNCLNTVKVDFSSANMQKEGTQNLCNSLFYNHHKLGIIKSTKITHGKTGSRFVRAIDYHALYVKGDYLKTSTDTVKFTQLVAHLKAGSAATERGYAAEGVMYKLEQNKDTGNFLIGGDFNVYRSSEAAYQNFTKYTKVEYRFNDPINREGSWHDNSSFKDVHTQSTRTTGNCGGMDDRFDMILASQDIISNAKSVRYIPGSYRAVGQDGKRFNGNVLSPTNQDVPGDIAQALFNMSDHLPVVLKLEVSYEVPSSTQQFNDKLEISIVNPSEQKIAFISQFANAEEMQIEVLSLDGRKVFSTTKFVEAGYHINEIPMHQAGVYILRLYAKNRGIIESQKTIVW